MKAVLENENKDIGLYYKDRLDFEATRDDMERRGLTDGFIIDEMIGKALAELSAEQGIDDLQIISLDDPNIKEIIGAEAISGRAYHTGEGKVIIVADNIEDFASAIGTITEEGRYIYHRNNNGLEDSEDYASFYGELFKNYYNRVAGDTSLVMIGSELGYNAGQLGNDWEDYASILYNEASPFKIKDFGHIAIEVDGKVYTYGRYGETFNSAGTKGEGILLIVDKGDYLNYYQKNTTVREFVLNLSEDKEEQIKKYFTEIQKNYNDTFTSPTRNWKGYKLNSKYNYDLTKLNCTIITINSLNTALNEKIPTIIVPKEFAKYLVGRVFAEKMGLKKNNIIE